MTFRGVMRRLHALLSMPVAQRPAVLKYRCNICARLVQTKVIELGREMVSCCYCGSTVRSRALIHLLSLHLYGRSCAICEFPCQPGVRVLDMSGWDEYGRRLKQRIDYLNTYYHKEPRLDITAIDESWHGQFDVVISSEVLEHVVPPVSVAFANLWQLLKPGGMLILTVPYRKEGVTIEHFPALHAFELTQESGQWCLINTTREGCQERFNNLIFHGGAGSTLEIRVFSRSGLLHELTQADFVDIRFHDETAFDDGILWQDNWSLPVTARRPA